MSYAYVRSFVFTARVIMVLVSVVPELAQAAEQRLALVIGNAAYANSPLRNPVNDARDLAAVLTQQGFSVTRLLNASRQQMEEAVENLRMQLQAGDVALFYFSGHGTQVEGTNYLLPVDVDLHSEADVKHHTLSARWVVDKLAEAGNRLNVVIFDACRNPPSFTRQTRTVQEGLAAMSAASGMLIAYATAPGMVARDGKGDHSPYTEYLLKYLQEPDLPVEQVFKRVRTAVGAATGKQQVPWETTSLEGEDFYFASCSSWTSPTADGSRTCLTLRPQPVRVPSPNSPVAPTTPPVTTLTPIPAISVVTVTTVELGNQIGSDKRVMQPMTSFAPKDTLYATVVTNGSARSATLTARWTYQDEQLVSESTQTIAPTGPAATEFHLTKPDGWPIGTYKVEVFLNGRSTGTKEFEVKRY